MVAESGNLGVGVAEGVIVAVGVKVGTGVYVAGWNGVVEGKTVSVTVGVSVSGGGIVGVVVASAPWSQASPRACTSSPEMNSSAISGIASAPNPRDSRSSFFFTGK